MVRQRNRCCFRDLLYTLNNFLDIAPFHNFMCGGGGTFLHHRFADFWREAQHLPNVRMYTLYGVMEEHKTLDLLELISNLLGRQAWMALHDS